MSADQAVSQAPQAPQASQVCVDCDKASLQPNPPASATTHPHHPPTSQQTPFEPPSPSSLEPRITIEFCDRCRWAPRAIWIQTELFLTFSVPILRSITLQPLTSPETGGRFRVWVYLDDRVELVWDRKTEGGFPELKILKQRIRNLLQPDLSLGHSDKPSTRETEGQGTATSRTLPAAA
ncbi:Rdx family-domain-containing protein [Papiliotrema laurentii]|uniref:Rdx family-domain-containing protein n=1 Tax=Papiliotrema laurentii TaxID=5418 RepID=A0AAD9L681_PAPLA|nr:Rdx family-domain-containing protein [Papiliotrema laurentii]